MLAQGYDGLHDTDIRAMSHEQLVEAVLRLTHVHEHCFDKSSSWSGFFLLPDDLADAFRGRV